MQERGMKKGKQQQAVKEERRIDINDVSGWEAVPFHLKGEGENFLRSPSGKRCYHVDSRARAELKGDNKNVRSTQKGQGNVITRREEKQDDTKPNQFENERHQCIPEKYATS